jgi:hypothetical protein
MRNVIPLFLASLAVACGGAIETESTGGSEARPSEARPSQPAAPSGKSIAAPDPLVSSREPPTILESADSDTCSTLKSQQPSGRLELLVGEPPRLDRPEPYVAVVATQFADTKDRDVKQHVGVTFTTLAGGCSWVERGVLPSYESHRSFFLSTPDVAGPGVYDKDLSWAAGGSFMSCPGTLGGGGGGSASASSPAKLTITARTATSVSGTVEQYDGNGKLVFQANFEAPFCAASLSPPPPVMRCCTI